MSKTYRDFFLTEDAFLKENERFDKCKRKFTCQFMNNAKWRKVFCAIFSNPNLIQHCEVVTFCGGSGCAVLLLTELQNVNFEEFIYSDCIDEQITTEEYATSYRAIEYLEFRKTWVGEHIGKLVPRKTYEQDIEQIQSFLSEIGQFEWDLSENYLRLIAYRQ